MNPWTEAEGEALYQSYVVELARELGELVVIQKRDSRLCLLIDKVLRALTFGKQDRFLSSYTTTLGRRIYVPDDWRYLPALERYLILRHEAVHVRQFKRFTFPGMVLLYLLLPLPFGFAGGRAWLEWQGYRETLVATWQVRGREAAMKPELTDFIVKRFTGADYGWMWVFGGTVRRAIRKTLEKLEREPPRPVRSEFEGSGFH